MKVGGFLDLAQDSTALHAIGRSLHEARLPLPSRHGPTTPAVVPAAEAASTKGKNHKASAQS